MNLGQAAAVIAYELSRDAAAETAPLPRLPWATAGQREDLIEWAVRAMERLEYSRQTSSSGKAERLRRWLNRAPLARQDAGLLRDFFKRAASRP
jgi:tRNA C32,U32 (ribose-2'-O)-methylase TrmJ